MKIYKVLWHDEQDEKCIRWFSNKAKAEKFRKAQDDGSFNAYMQALDIQLTKQNVLHFLNIYVQ